MNNRTEWHVPVLKLTRVGYRVFFIVGVGVGVCVILC